jgi:hypothetical protein
MKLQAGYLSDFISLLFPELCRACGESLVAGEELLCIDCRYHLPYTDFHLKTVFKRHSRRLAVSKVFKRAAPLKDFVDYYNSTGN